ncbi:MAG: hypothetical protein ACREQD_14170, partial [Candidatus Binataceae bacterium]
LLPERPMLARDFGDHAGIEHHHQLAVVDEEHRPVRDFLRMRTWKFQRHKSITPAQVAVTRFAIEPMIP